MQSIGKIMKRFEEGGENQPDLKTTVETIIDYPPIRSFIEAHEDELSQEMIENSLSKLNEFMREHEAQERGEAGQNPGFSPELFINGSYIDVTYVPTAEYYDYKASQQRKSRLNNRMMSRDVRQASLDSFYTNTPQRKYLLKEVMDFIKAYQENPHEAQALYIYGEFGVGKTYLLGALANYLVDNLGVSVTMLHYPSFTTEMKNTISEGGLQDSLDEIKRADVLILDDIGAESNTVWVRDEILNTILEHRMKESLPTFFTSNFSMDILQKHLERTRDGKDTGKALRIMERIRYLSREVEFNGENLRQAKRQGKES